MSKRKRSTEDATVSGGVNDNLQAMFARRIGKIPQRKVEQTKVVRRKWKNHDFIYSSNDSDFADCSLASASQTDVSPSAHQEPAIIVDRSPTPIVVIVPSDEDPDSEETAVSPSFVQMPSPSFFVQMPSQEGPQMPSQEGSQMSSQEGPPLTFAQPDPETPESEVSWSSDSSQVRTHRHALTHTDIHSNIHTCAHILALHRLRGPPGKGHARHSSGHVYGHVRHCGGYASIVIRRGRVSRFA